MQARLYAIPASNASLTAQLALDRKQIPYRRIDQLPVLHWLTMRLRGFEGSTVPGLVIDGRKVHGSGTILRALDELAPDPRLYPEDPQQRATVDKEVAWGEHVYQRTLRYLLPYSLLRRPRAVSSVLEGAQMSLPTGLVVAVSKPAIYVNSLRQKSNSRTVHEKLGELSEMFDHVDDLIARGVLNADEPGAADMMIAPTTRAFLWWQDLRPVLEKRPAAAHARRLAPNFDADIPPVLPRA
ncbi:MAG TPA: glutathione S-transferase N-terminal domain-containing protein [Thermoleophilaceae bacterium]